jgi:hypothetical protein
MSHTIKYGNHGADNIVTRLIPVELTLSQFQLQAFELKMNKQISIELYNRGHLIVQHDAAVIGFTELLSQLQQLGIKVRDSGWFHIKTEWYDFVDNNIASHANQRPKVSCNRVPRI